MWTLLLGSCLSWVVLIFPEIFHCLFFFLNLLPLSWLYFEISRLLGSYLLFSILCLPGHRFLRDFCSADSSLNLDVWACCIAAVLHFHLSPLFAWPHDFLVCFLFSLECIFVELPKKRQVNFTPCMSKNITMLDSWTEYRILH